MGITVKGKFGRKVVTSTDTDGNKFIKGNLYGQKVKRKKDGTCMTCKKEIHKGDIVLIVERNDGYNAKFAGLSHIECFSL